MQKEEIVIVVPIYKKQLSDLEKISLTQLQRVLGDYPRVFQAPESLEFDYGCLGEGFSVERFPDEYFTGVYSYSHLMLEADFYRRFDKYKYMLIYQLDAFVFSDKLLEFCEMGYDYIGAPVYPLTPHWHAIGTCVGNGGFSLRKIDSAIQMLEYSHSWLQTDPFKDVLVDWEDLFWAYCGMKKNLSFQIPPKSIALKFSVQDNVKIPPSLQNIYKELYSDLGIPPKNTGNLTGWAKEGVLLLNSTLTVEKDKANSHQGLGWQYFTDYVIKVLNLSEKPIVFILWGNFARSKKVLITNPKHLILESPHPSPFSAYNGFFGSKPFSKTNDFLIKNNIKPIDWSK